MKILLKLAIGFILSTLFISCVSETEQVDGSRAPASVKIPGDEFCSIVKPPGMKVPTDTKVSVCQFNGDDEKKHDLRVVQLKELSATLGSDFMSDTKMEAKSGSKAETQSGANADTNATANSKSETKIASKNLPNESRSIPSAGSSFFSPQEYNKKGLGPLHAINVNGGNGELHLVLVAASPHKYFLIVDGHGIAVAGANDLGQSISLHAVPFRDSLAIRSISSANVNALSQQTEILSEFLSRGDSSETLLKKMQDKKVPGHWSAFIADAKSGQSATLEIGKDKVRLWQDPLRRGKPVGQSNHFLSAQMQDQYEFESFGATLDSHARYLRLFGLMTLVKPGEMSLGESLDMLGDHFDRNVPTDSIFGNERSFGSTVVRSDTRAVVLIQPELVHPKVWLSINDHASGPLNHLAGFEIDFSNLQWKSLGLIQNEKYTELTDWNQSFDYFATGVFHAQNENWEDAISAIDSALASAEKDRHRFDPFYHFAKARLLLKMAIREDDLGIRKEELILALTEFDAILAHRQLLGNMKSNDFFANLTGASLVESYTEAITKMYSVAAAIGLDDLRSAMKSDEQLALIEKYQMNSDQKAKRLLSAGDTLQFILKQTQSPDIGNKLQFLEGLKSKTKFDDLPWAPVDLISIVN